MALQMINEIPMVDACENMLLYLKGVNKIELIFKLAELKDIINYSTKKPRHEFFRAQLKNRYNYDIADT